MTDDFSQTVLGHQIDFLAVSPESERSGDAIACRYKLADGTQRVIVIDCGTKEAGERLVAFIKENYGTTHVDHVVNTHPDQDHTSGLTVVLEQLSVGRLWMHQPWNHSEDILHLFQDGRMTSSSLEERIRDGLTAAHALEELAIAKKVPISEPFQGSKIGRFLVVAPSVDRYRTLIPHFDNTPEAKAARVAERFLAVLKKAAATVYGVFESWTFETLSSSATTSDTNDSSVCLLGELTDNQWVLFTGDAGVGALTELADYLEGQGLAPAGRLKFVQVPHHGSRNNVTPAALDRILGVRVSEDARGSRGTAFVSAGGTSTTHPRRVVVNAFLRRGYKVMLAKTDPLTHSWKLPFHAGYSTVESVALFAEVESE